MTADASDSAREMWALGDYSQLAELLQPAADELVRAAGVRAGQRVLDAAAGNGNVAAAAAARDAVVTATDFTPRMVELGRARTETAGLSVEWAEADAERLPYPDAAFDAALSAFGIIFAPRPAAAISEARRVLTPGGTFACTAWPVDGYLYRVTEEMRRWLPPAPADGPDAFTWGTEAAVRDLLGGSFPDVRVDRGTLTWRFPTLAAMTEYWHAVSPSHVAAAGAAGEQATAMFAAIEELTRPHAAADGSVAIDVDYLVVVAR